MNQTYQTKITYGNTKSTKCEWCYKTSEIPAEHSPQTNTELTEGDIYNIGDAYYIVALQPEFYDISRTYGQELTADDYDNDMLDTYYLEYGGARHYYDEIVKSIGRQIHSESVECSISAVLRFEECGDDDGYLLLCFKPSK